MDLGIEGRTALVTGASKGIGLGIARALAEEGARVAMSSRSRERIEAAARQVPGAHALVHDSTDLEGAARLVGTAEEELGPIEILVANTGGPPAGPDALAFAPDQWEAAYRSLVLAPMALIERAVPGMRERGWGRIVNVSSGVVDFPGDMVSANAYVTSKSALEGHTLNLAAELAGTGVTVNVLRPGMVNTSMQAWIREQPIDRVGAALHDWFMQMQESGMLVEPDEPARMIAELVVSQANGEVVDARQP